MQLINKIQYKKCSDGNSGGGDGGGGCVCVQHDPKQIS